MKCPYRVNEKSICKNGATYNYKEFAECYGKLCPYFDAYHMSECSKVTNEIGCYSRQEVH